MKFSSVAENGRNAGLYTMVANFAESLKFERQRASFNSHFSAIKCAVRLRRELQREAS